MRRYVSVVALGLCGVLPILGAAQDPAAARAERWLGAVGAAVARQAVATVTRDDVERMSVLIEFRAAPNAAGPVPTQRERTQDANAADANAAPDREAAAAMQRAVESPARALSAALREQGMVVERAFAYQPLLLAMLSRDDIARLAAREDVVAVHPNVRERLPGGETTQSEADVEREFSAATDDAIGERERPQLAVSTVAINADKAWARGFRGQGTAIAILDTGIVASHEMFRGKIVAEACFSDNFGFPQFIDGLCPGVAKSAIGPGTASLCTGGGLVCDHGSHVAGIAAGNNRAASNPRQGVAPEANLIPIQVFSRDTGCTGPGCLAAAVSDQIAALDWLIANGPRFNLVAVNLSLGSSAYNSVACNTDPRNSAFRTLRTMGITATVASGNEGYLAGVSTPACIAPVLTVSAVSSATTPAPSPFGNNAGLVDVMAPGEFISSAIFGTNASYGFKSGTSMAAPHVAGAVAILKSRTAAATPDQIEAALEDSGFAVTRPTWTWTSKRIDVNAALDILGQPPAPAGVPLTGFYPAARTDIDSLLRIMNPSSAQANVSLTVVQNAPRRTLGTYGALVLPRRTLQLSLAEIETALGTPAAADSILTIYASKPITTLFYAQHIAVTRASESLTNLTACAQDLVDREAMLGNVHTPLIAAAQSVITLHNTSGLARRAVFDVSDARTGTSIGVLGTEIIEAGGRLSLPAPQAFTALNFDPTTNVAYANFLLRPGFDGVVKHLMINRNSATIADMTPKCPI
ncbi:MAG: S8 family serine peptidase [Rhodospirillaceae bacterium]|nr:S8 family serine peptidase [Rhodospirillaceae bacterium]